jgi:hypothetical protein
MAEVQRKRKVCDSTQEALADQGGYGAGASHVDIEEGDLVSIVDCDKLFDIKSWKRGVLSGVPPLVHYPARVLKVLENGNVHVQWVGFEKVKGCGPFNIQLSDLRVSTAKSSQELRNFCEMCPRQPVPDIHISKDCIDEIRTIHSFQIANSTRPRRLAGPSNTIIRKELEVCNRISRKLQLETFSQSILNQI